MNYEIIAEKFGLTGVSSVTEIKNGHINKTFLLQCDKGRYIMQSLNRDIFGSAETVMDNISLISGAFGASVQTLLAVPCYLGCDGKNYAEIDGEIWRIYRYTEVSDKYTPYSHGLAVGTFLRIVNTANITFTDAHPTLHSRFRELSLPIRNIHGDTKADNVIFGDILTFIDLDTASRNTVLVDYGDMIRSLTSNGFHADSVREATQGFADGLMGLLTSDEVNSLYLGITLIVTELMERYMEGNRNFPNKSPEQCLERAHQLAFQLEDLRIREKEIRKIISDCFS